MPPKKTPQIKYDVEQYLIMLRRSKRSEQTIANYRKVLNSYARFLKVPLDQVHHHLSVSNLLKFADSRNQFSDYGTKNVLSILHRYFSVNGIVFDEMEYNAVRPKVEREHNDKPLELTTLQKMMDLTDAHGRALLSFLVSTGCRPGETCEILLSDVKGDMVAIRNEIAKGHHGGTVFLTAEAREYIDLWLRERDAWIKTNRARAVKLRAGPKPKPGEPDTRKIIVMQKNDQRLFALSYSSLQGIFSRLYDKVDGEQGKYHAKCTVHACRKYFRTQAALGGMHPDLVTGIMRQTGYLDSTYVRMTEEERQKQFHEHETALYITRADHRIQTGKLSELERRNAELTARLAQVEQVQQEKSAIRAAGAELSPTQMQELAEKVVSMMTK
ncbi:tyrosine-type recombinase/integrase [Methanoregula sp.]|uniref:tyrosine-type recombinase/integrase n=1 Tax=Methanoregula sp. TaxID=2052170 RepID=UPI003BAE5960